MEPNKSVSIIIRTTPDMRDSFKSVCEQNDFSSSDVLRSFIESYIAKEGQMNLFSKKGKKKNAR